jgi:putative acyl-CoA dehydrogenase
MSALSAEAPRRAKQKAANQSPPRVGIDELDSNPPLMEAVARHDGAWALERLHEVGRMVGAERYQGWARQADTNPPELLRYDRYGQRVDEVRYDRAYHQLMATAIALGVHAAPWRQPRAGAHVARAAAFMLLAQVEAGHGCVTSMAYSAVPALRAQPDCAAEWEPRLCSLSYDPRPLPIAQKDGALCGMAMTERQGGSDVRANTTTATPAAPDADGEYLLNGRKWLFTAPSCDAFLVLAQSEPGLSCFLVPRVLCDGERNGIALDQLVAKLGNRTTATAEVTLEQAKARLIGEAGRGTRTIIEMVAHTRLDCILSSTAGMRQAVAEATWHAAHRRAFGGRLIEQPLMANVLADLCLEAEAATACALRLARSYDADASAQERQFRRLASAVVKYWVCRRGPRHAFEAMECLGGSGYLESSALARRYREQPLMAIWEGSGNVICLDVLRAISRNPETLQAFMCEVDAAAGANAQLDAYVSRLRAELSRVEQLQYRARRVVEMLALALQGSLLVRHAPAEISDAFCAARLTPEHGEEYGTLDHSVNIQAILSRHAPDLS